MKISKIVNHRSLSILLFAGILLVSCKNNDKAPGKLEQGTSMGKTVSDLAKQSRALKNTEPVTEEEFKGWFPKTLQGLELRNIAKGPLTGHGISGAVAQYEGTGKKNFSVTINDGAGKKGMMLLSQFATIRHLKPEQDQDENKQQKFYDNKTILGIEAVYKNEKKVVIDFLYKSRFAVNLEANGLEKEAVWEAIEDLDIDELF